MKQKEHKACRDYGEIKSLDEFYRHPQTHDGYLDNSEARKKYHAVNLKRWRRKYPEKMAVQLARRRTRKLLAEEEFEALCEEYGNVCLRCGKGDALLTPDHVVPLSLGGSNGIENIQPLCLGCNCWKNVKVVDCRTVVDSLEVSGTSRSE